MYDTTTSDPIVYALIHAAKSNASQTLGDPGTPARRYATRQPVRVPASLGDPGTPGRRY